MCLVWRSWGRHGQGGWCHDDDDDGHDGDSDPTTAAPVSPAPRGRPLPPGNFALIRPESEGGEGGGFRTRYGDFFDRGVKTTLSILTHSIVGWIKRGEVEDKNQL